MNTLPYKLLLILMITISIACLSGCSKDPSPAGTAATPDVPSTDVTGTWTLTTAREIDRTNNIVTYDSTYQEPAGGNTLTLTPDGHAYHNGFDIYTDTSTYVYAAPKLTFRSRIDTAVILADTVYTLTTHSLRFRETDTQGDATNVQHVYSYKR